MSAEQILSVDQLIALPEELVVGDQLGRLVGKKWAESIYKTIHRIAQEIAEGKSVVDGYAYKETGDGCGLFIQNCGRKAEVIKVYPLQDGFYYTYTSIRREKPCLRIEFGVDMNGNILERSDGSNPVSVSLITLNAE